MYCTHCGTEINDMAVQCIQCGGRVQPARPMGPPMMGGPGGPPGYPQAVPANPMNDPGMKLLLPVGRSGLAIAAGYLGLFSLLGIFAPFAVLVSIAAMVDLKNNPEKSGWGRAIFGLIMGSIVCVLFGMAVIGNMGR